MHSDDDVICLDDDDDDDIIINDNNNNDGSQAFQDNRISQNNPRRKLITYNRYVYMYIEYIKLIN